MNGVRTNPKTFYTASRRVVVLETVKDHSEVELRKDERIRPLDLTRGTLWTRDLSLVKRKVSEMRDLCHRSNI